MGNDENWAAKATAMRAAIAKIAGDKVCAGVPIPRCD